MTLVPSYCGKVRDVYDIGGDELLMVASDRISAFDVVFDEPVPEKGRVLTGLTTFWLNKVLADVAPNHLISTNPADFPSDFDDLDDLAGRAMYVRKADMLTVECIVRGYLSGSAWKEYQASGTMHGTKLPSGMQQSQKLPEPIFTPSTKAPQGDHDENISFEDAVDMIGSDVAEEARRISLEAYQRGADYAAQCGIIIADTKFELGFIDGELCICDEVLTPDSSRFWPTDEVVVGATPPSFDKQPVRDWVETIGWNKAPPAPALPDDVIKATTERYVGAYERLTRQGLADWFGGDRR